MLAAVTTHVTWTPDQWLAIALAVIGAIAGGVAACISAWKGNKVQQQVTPSNGTNTAKIIEEIKRVVSDVVAPAANDIHEAVVGGPSPGRGNSASPPLAGAGDAGGAGGAGTPLVGQPSASPVITQPTVTRVTPP